jgi:hypothetical protein
MEQASKRSSHEGGLLLDPLHKETCFPTLLKDCEDRQRRVSTQYRSSVSGFPPPVVRRLAANTNRKFFTDYFFCSDHGVLLQQLMSEMKYMRERVDIFPTGPMQGVSASPQTSSEIQEPRSQSSSSWEVDEHTALPCISQVTVPVQPLETSTSSANLKVSEMVYFSFFLRIKCFIRKQYKATTRTFT